MRSLLVLSLLFFGYAGHGQIIDFPDANFKNALVNTKCVDTDGDGFGDIDADVNNDGEIDVNEASQVINLYIRIKGITDLTGIEKFLNIVKLFCDQNLLSILDLSQNSELEVLNCSSNKISTLNVLNNSKLKNINCSDNSLFSVDFSGLKNIEFLTCFRSKVNDIKLDECSNVKELRVWENNISKLDISHLKNLGWLYAHSNPFESLDLTSLNNLSHVLCAKTRLKSLDITHQKKIINIDLDECTELIAIFAKSGRDKEIPYIELSNCPNLSYICTDEVSISKFLDNLPSSNLTEVNSYCSFVPGLDFFIIDGVNYYDFDNNGCSNTDKYWPNLKFEVINDTGVKGTKISNASGKNNFALIEGTHTITPTLENPEHFEVTPSSFTFTFPFTSDTITQDFCITPKGIYRRTDITVIPLTPPARPGFEAKYKIVWENKGNQIESGTLNFTYDESRLDYISATSIADIVSDGIVKWNFSDLRPFEKREIIVTLRLNRPTDTPAVNTGDKLYLTASILDNSFTLENTVVGSYDPNDKTCLQGDRVHPNKIGKYVDFIIRFENTGNYPAENVVVKDIIDTTTFDVSSLQITDSSHEMFTRIEGNKVEFIFENIQLPFDDANNDGYVAFKIKTLPTLMVGDSLKNLADIYFDYNFPIRTNETKSTLAFPVGTSDIEKEVKIYPNPVKDILTFDSQEAISKVEIYSMDGRIIRSMSVSQNQINIEDVSSGTYAAKVFGATNAYFIKIVKL